jgi:hypothetical protein
LDKLSPIVILVLGTGLFLSPAFVSSTTTTVAQLGDTMPPTVLGTDVNGQQHEMPLKATVDLTTQAVTNIQGFTIREQDVIPLERNGEFVVTLQPQQRQIISVTFTTIDGQSTVELQQISQGRYSLQNIPEGEDEYICTVRTQLSPTEEIVNESMCVFGEAASNTAGYGTIINRYITNRQIVNQVTNNIIRAPANVTEPSPSPSPSPSPTPTPPVGGIVAPPPAGGGVPPTTPPPPCAPGITPTEAVPCTVGVPPDINGVCTTPGHVIRPLDRLCFPREIVEPPAPPGVPEPNIPDQPAPLCRPGQISTPQVPCSTIVPGAGGAGGGDGQQQLQPAQAPCPVKPDTECPPGFRLQKGGPTESDRCVRIVMPDTPDPPQQQSEEEDNDNDSNSNNDDGDNNNGDDNGDGNSGQDGDSNQGQSNDGDGVSDGGVATGT